MTKLEQAARQALETLERASDAGYSVECDETITALREALEQVAPRKTERWNPMYSSNAKTALQMAAVIAHRDTEAAPPAEQTVDPDGEAFRTAARLGLTLRFYGACAQSSMPGTPSAYVVTHGGDRAEAMREAVEKAAAIIASGGEAPKAPLAPPAEQQAQPGAVYAELPAPTASIGTDDAWHEAAMRDFADRTHALSIQAAPKAAPGEPSADSLRHQNKLLAETLGACILASGIVRKDIDGFTGAELLHFGEDLRSMLEAAPKQEVQEPCGWTTGITWRPDTRLQSEQVIKITRDTQPKYGYTTPIYTAPQPAPAPLSEMPYEKRKAIQEGEQIGASDAWFKARHEMLDTVDRRNVFRAGFDRGWSAALAAQGGSK